MLYIFRSVFFNLYVVKHRPMEAYWYSQGKVPGVLNLGSRRKAVVSLTVSGCVFFQIMWEQDFVSLDFFLSIIIQKRITVAFFLPRWRFSYQKYPHLLRRSELLSNSGHGLYIREEYTSLSYSVKHSHSTDLILDKITKTRGLCYRRMLTVVYRILLIRCIILLPVYDSAKKVAVVTIMYCNLRSSRTNVLNP